MKKQLSVILTILMVFMLIPTMTLANDNEDKLVKYNMLGAQGKDISEESINSYSISGMIPSLPKQYNLMDEGRATSIKDQNDTGLCWVYSTISGIESNLITRGLASEDINLSEYPLGYSVYNGKSGKEKSTYAGKDRFICSESYDLVGGNRYLIGATLTRWYGAIDESEYDVSSNNSISGNLKYKSNIHVNDVEYLPEIVEIKNGKYVTNKDSIVEMKSAIKNSGAVSIGMYLADDYTGKYYNKKNYSQYVYKYKEPDHEISVIGWDDDYPKEKMKTSSGHTPSKDGAWIAKNSYGNDIYDNGLYYISYYDLSINEPTLYIPEDATYNGSNTVHEDTSIYQYDGVGNGDMSFTYSDMFKVANLFYAREDEMIQRMTVYVARPNSTVKVNIYGLPYRTQPTSGRLLAAKTVSFENAGYHTIELDKAVGIPSNERFSVSTYIKSNGVYEIPLEEEEAASSGNNYAKIDFSKKQTFYKVSGSKWQDIANENFADSGEKFGNALIKARGNEAGNSKQTISVERTQYTKSTKSKNFKIDAISSANTQLLYRSTNTKVATVSHSGIIDIKGKGTAKIAVLASPTEKYSSAKKVITIKVK